MRLAAPGLNSWMQNGIEPRLIPLAIRLQPRRHVRVDTHGGGLLGRSVERMLRWARPQGVVQRRDVAGVDRCVRHGPQGREFGPLRASQARHARRINHKLHGSLGHHAAFPSVPHGGPK